MNYSTPSNYPTYPQKTSPNYPINHPTLTRYLPVRLREQTVISLKRSQPFKWSDINFDRLNFLTERVSWASRDRHHSVRDVSCADSAPFDIIPFDQISALYPSWTRVKIPNHHRDAAGRTLSLMVNTRNLWPDPPALRIGATTPLLT
jgi:hypothetical protein